MSFNYKLLKKNEIDSNLIDRIDSFIMSNYSNGEFINTIKYLKYHKNRFNEDYVAVVNSDSFDIYGFVIGTVSNNKEFVSHMGTTFSGIIVNDKLSIERKELVVKEIISYLESSYTKITYRFRPSLFGAQPDDSLNYIMIKNEYIPSIKDLSSVIEISQIRSEDDLLNMYDSKRRNEVRKSISNDFVFKKEDTVDRHIWDNMNNNLKERYNSKTVHTFEEICELKEKFSDKIVPYTVYTKNGDYVAFSLVYKYKNVFHTQYLDVNYDYANLYPNLFLIHNLLIEAKNKGYQLFSFGGCTVGEEKDINYGLYNYKDGFGGGNMLLLEYTKVIK